MHVRKSRVEWREIVRAFERSGETHEAFCAGRGLKLGSFRGWLYRIRREPSAEVRLVRVDVPGRVRTIDTVGPAPLRVATSSPIIVWVRDIEVRVAQGWDPAYVAALVRELGRC
jgi:hypothetical protein